MANNIQKIHLLAFGAHPDDVELSAAGTLLSHQAMGYKTGIIDLTEGELGTRGSVEDRRIEAAEASRILNLTIRENLGFADGFFANDKAHQMEVIRMIRKYQPDIVLCNASYDRHPDHGRGGNLVEEACFYAGLQKIKTQWNGVAQDCWRPRLVLKYIQFLPLEPDLIVDISPYLEQKIASVKAYASQFYKPGSSEPETIISSASFLESVRYRCQDLGRIIGTAAGEGFQMRRPPAIKDLNQII